MSTKARKAAATAVFVLLVAATVAAYLALIDAQPEPGTVDLALARDGTAAERLIEFWDIRGLDDDAKRAIWIDFGFIALYAPAIAWGCIRAGRIYRSDLLRSIATPLAWSMAGVAVLDMTENALMLQMLQTGVTPVLHVLATTAAWVKFAAFFIAYGYAVTGLATWLVRSIFESSIQRVPFLRPFRAHAQVARLTKPEQLVRDDYHEPVPEWRAGEWTPVQERRIGICCSGGGVRSAAYNLGALQVLRDRGVLTEARYLSAVSGGSYTAAALAMTQRETDRHLIEEMPEFAPGSPEEEYLRNRSSYLAPGLHGKARAALQAVLGLSINVLFFWLVLFVVARPAGWLISMNQLHPELKTSARLEFPATMLAPIAATLVAALACALIPLLTRLRKRASTDRWMYAAAFLAIVAGLLLVAAVVLPYLTRALPRWLRWLPDQRPAQTGSGTATPAGVTNAVWLIQTLGLGTMAAAAVRALFATKRSILILLAGGLVAPVLAAGTFVLFAGSAARVGPEGPLRLFGQQRGEEWMWFAATALVLFVFYRLSDQTTWSLHPFYKRRLCSAFALRRVQSDQRIYAEELDYDRLQSLSRYRPRCQSELDPAHPHACTPGIDHQCREPEKCDHDCRPWPELIVCAAANVSDEGATPPGRNAVSFTFTSTDIGGPRIGWMKTNLMEAALGPRRKQDITMPAAVAISGAAFSPAMGKMTRGPIGPLVALANMRLGVWLPHPLWVKELASRTTDDWVDRPRVLYLLKEVFGRYRLNDRFLYVTDGGHWDNLGLVELLRRGCTEIYCFDASGDQVDTFFTLGEAVALARTELGVEIVINPEKMKPPAAPPKKSEGGTAARVAPRAPVDHVVGVFRYRNGVQGRIVFAKAAVTSDAPWDVRAYADFDEKFPTHSTLDQLYTDKKFEAYRALGAFAAANAVQSMGPPPGSAAAAAPRRASTARRAKPRRAPHARARAASGKRVRGRP